MTRHALWRSSTLALVACDVLLMVLAGINVASVRLVPELPEECRPSVPDPSNGGAQAGTIRRVLRFEGEEVDTPELLRYHLCNRFPGDSVTVVIDTNGDVSERRIRLVSRYSVFELWTIVVVGTLFMVFAMYILVFHPSRPFTAALHGVAVCTGMMVLLDWGSLCVHPPWFNALRWVVFDAAIWLLPGLFLHFSFCYPGDKGGHKRLFTSIFYAVSAVGLGISVYCLVQIYFLGIPLYATPYLGFHAGGSDVFLMAGLLATIANLEHTALTIRDPLERKRIYWVLLGISFGPLVYVFLILVPRTLLGYELVSQSMMQYTLLMAPLMFTLAVRNRRTKSSGAGEY